MLVCTLQNLDRETKMEIIGDELVDGEYNRASDALVNGADACVLCCAADGGEIQYSYFDIVLANGMRFDAVSAYHLSGISEWK